MATAARSGGSTYLRMLSPGFHVEITQGVHREADKSESKSTALSSDRQMCVYVCVTYAAHVSYIVMLVVFCSAAISLLPMCRYFW